MKFPITCIMVVLNEEHNIRKSLGSYSFCDQIIVVDVGSHDNSMVIAEEMGAEVIQHEWTAIPEQVWPDMIHLARNDWILIADADEEIPYCLAEKISVKINNNNKDAIIWLPRKNFFLNKPVNGTTWGGITYSPKIFNKNRVRLNCLVHRPVSPMDNYSISQINGDDKIIIIHHPGDELFKLLKKVVRYYRLEGEARFKTGQRFSWFKWLYYDTFGCLKYNLLDLNGINGGPREIFLSFMHTWYEFNAGISLRRYQESQKNFHDKLE